MKDQDSTVSKNICFIANFYKTYFFHEIATYLTSNRFNVFWLVPKDSQAEFLTAYYPKKSILSINRSNILKTEQPINDYKINELIYGDRVLRNEIPNGQKFLTNIQKPIYDFIAENKINLILGEVTWAHELLVHRMVTAQRELNCSYYSMHTVRIPNGRFAFFEDEKQTKILECSTISRSTNIQQKYLTIEKPAYLKSNDAIIKKNMSFSGRLSRVKRLITGENIEKTDPNVNVRGFYRWWFPIREEVNRACYKSVKKYKLQEFVNEPYIFFGFHKQPEASVDVCGRYFENQMDNVLNLWRVLPPKWKLVVKEHTNAIGDRSLPFYRKLKKYPNIILADEKIDSHILIKNSKLVATNTGTMALEAALMNIPAITFSSVFFNKHCYCRHANWVDLEKYGSITKLITEIVAQQSNSEEYTSYILSNTFEGVIGDVFSNPKVVDPDNIKNIATAILKIADDQ